MICKTSPVFDHAHPITIKPTFSFLKFVSTLKKSAHFINSFLRQILYFRFPRPKRPFTFLNTTQKLLKKLLAFLNLYQHSKNQFIKLILEIQPILESWDQSGHTHSWPRSPQRCNQILIFMNLYQQAKNQVFKFFFLEI